MLHLSLQFDHKSIISGADGICFNLDHDLFCPISKLQGRDCLSCVVAHWVDSCYQSRLGIATQRVLKQSGDLWVSVGNMVFSLALCQCWYDFSKRWETQVDGLQLKKLLSSHLVILMYLFTSGQIAKIELATEEHTTLISCIAFHQYLEDGMWSRWMYVCSRLSGNTISLTSFEQLKTIICCADNILWLPFHKYASILVLSDVQSPVWIFVLKEVVQFFIVNLKEWAINGERSVGVVIHHLINSLEQVLNWTRNDAIFLRFAQKWVSSLWFKTARQSTHRILIASHIVIPVRSKHGESLSRPSLAICENGWIVSMQNICNIILDERKKLRLLRILVEHSVILGLY